MTAPASSVRPKGDGRDLKALAARLRKAKVSFGASELLDAARLIVRLGETQRETADVASLKPFLRSVLCKRVEERRAFDDAFNDWVASMQPVPVLVPEPTPDRRRWYWGLVVLIGAAALATALFILLRPVKTPPGGSPPPIASAQVDQPPVDPSPTPSATTQPPSSPDEVGYMMAIRHNRELAPAWAFGGFGIALLPLLLIGVPAAMLSRHRGRSGRRVQLDTRELESRARRLVPDLSSEAGARLSRHVRGRADDPRRLARRPPIDVRRTVDATLRNLGIPTLRYRHAALRPSYVMLIEGEIETDPRTRLFYEWAKRLMREGWEVEIRCFRLSRGEAGRDAPRIYRIESTGWSESRNVDIPLDHLDDPPAAQRLLVLSDGASFAEKDGKLREWVSRARFRRWHERVFFTPTQMRNWAEREVGIEQREGSADPGFLVLPLDEPALEAWSLALSTGKLSGFTLSEPDRYPTVLVDRDLEARSPSRPFPDLEALIGQLKIYLGDVGFRWLAAVAVPPLLRWDLTLLIGTTLMDARVAGGALLGNSGPLAARRTFLLSLNYQRLTRLPWFRTLERKSGSPVAPGVPDWLRLRLLHELPPAAAEEIRGVVRTALATARPGSGEKGLELALEQPPAQVNRAPKGESDDAVDTVYLGYLSGLTPRQLSLRPPAGWSKWIDSLRLPERGHGFSAALQRVTDRLAARVATLAFRGGLSALGTARKWTVLAFLGLAAWAIVLFFVARTGPGALPPAIEKRLIVNRTRGIGLTTDILQIAIRFTPDEKKLLLADSEGTVRALDVATGAVIERWHGPASVIRRASFSDDASRLMTVSTDTAEVWDTSTHARLASVKGDQGPISNAVLSGDGNVLAISSGTQASVWDVRNGKPGVTAAQRGTVLAIALDRAGSQFAVLSAPGQLTILDALKAGRGLALDRFGSDDLAQVELSLRPKEDSTGVPCRLAFSPDGEHIVASIGVNWSHWGITAQKRLAVDEADVKEDISNLLLSSDGSRFAILTPHAVFVRAMSSGDLVSTWTSVRASEAAFSSDGSILAAGVDLTRLFTVRNVNSGAPITSPAADDATLITFSGKDNAVAIVDRDQSSVRVWFRAVRRAGAPWRITLPIPELDAREGVTIFDAALHRDASQDWFLMVAEPLVERPARAALLAAALGALVFLFQRIASTRQLARRASG